MTVRTKGTSRGVDSMHLRTEKDHYGRRDRGVALISVLLIFAIASVLAIRMMSTGSIQIESAEHIISQKQLENYARGVESYVVAILKQDMLQDNQQSETAADSAFDEWARLERFQLDQFDETLTGSGEILLRVEPVDHLFNVNNLLDAEGKRDSTHYQHFRRLIAQSDLKIGFAEQTVDWIDPDDSRGGLLGAEDNEYLLKEPPYRTPDAQLVHVSELLLLDETPVSVWPEFRHHIVALPGSSKANLNWISPEQLALLLNKSLIDTEQWLKRRESEPIDNLETFFNETRLDQENDKKRLAVRSEYFRLSVIVRIGDETTWLTSMIYRNLEEETIRVFSRERFPFSEKRVQRETDKETS